MTESRSFRVEAVVLRHNDWGEADRILVLYTREHGKIRAVAKGVRKIRSRKSGHLEPFTRVVLQLARGRDLAIITQAETVDACLPLRDDLARFGQAAYAAELLDRFTYEDAEANKPLYTLLIETISRIAHESDPWLTVRYYELHLLGHLGYRPMLFECSGCRKPIQAVDQYFSPMTGGVLCPECGRRYTGSWTVSMESLKYLRHFQRSSYQEIRRARPGPDVQRDLESLIQRYHS